MSPILTKSGVASLSIQKLNLVNISGRVSGLDRAIGTCVSSGIFHPEAPGANADSGGAYDNPFSAPLAALNDITVKAGIKPESLCLSGSPLCDAETALQELLRHLGDEFSGVYSLSSVVLRTGRMPADKKPDPNAPFPYVFIPLIEHAGEVAGIYFTEEGSASQADAMFCDLGFETNECVSCQNAISTELMGTIISEYLSSLERHFTSLNAQRQLLEGLLDNFNQAKTYLKHIKDLDVSFDEIFSCEYIKIRFGRLPADSYPKLSYFSDKPYLFITLDSDKHYYWGVYFSPIQYADEIDEIFSTLYFERLRVPDYIHDTPDVAEARLTADISDTEKKLKAVNDELAALCKTEHNRLSIMWHELSLLERSFALRRYVSYTHGNFYMQGFVPAADAKRFSELFEGQDIAVTILPPDSDPRVAPPTRLKNNRFMKPFEMFVEMYGLPSYQDIDPTPYIAITYTLLYGIMFGDLGQGLCIALIGLLLSRLKGMALGRIMTRIGLSSAFFGILYGSVFGFEEVLDPLFHNVLRLPFLPLKVMETSTTNLILGVAVGIGVTLIIISICFNIFIGFRQHNLERAVFSNNGIAGLVFYLFAAAAGGMLILSGVNILSPWLVILFIILPLLAILFKEPLSHLIEGERGRELIPEGGIGGFLIEGFFELFEVLLGFVTNTMSFLRVGGFVLSHAGMMMVVMMLSHSVNGAGSIVVAVIGNLFVIAMEGLIVGIQVLRLDFYEIFGRFFSGEGKEFKTINS